MVGLVEARQLDVPRLEVQFKVGNSWAGDQCAVCLNPMCVVLKPETAEGTCQVMRGSGVVMANICTEVLDPSGFKERVGLHGRKVNNDRPIAILKRVDLYSVSHCLCHCRQWVRFTSWNAKNVSEVYFATTPPLTLSITSGITLAGNLNRIAIVDSQNSVFLSGSQSLMLSKTL